MSELHTADFIADVDLADDVELPCREGAVAGLLRITLAKIYAYVFSKLFDYAAPVNVAYAATVALDGSTGVNFKITLTGALELANPTNMQASQSGLIILTQDATGGRVITYDTNWKFPGGAGTSGVLSTGANKVDTIAYFVRSDGTILCTLAKDFS